MKKIISIIMIIPIIITMYGIMLYADEFVFECENRFEAETEYEAISNFDEQENITEESIFFDEIDISEDSAISEENNYELHYQEKIEIFDPNETAALNESDFSRDASDTMENETIAEDPLFDNIVASGTCGEKLTWKLTGDEGNMTLTISGNGDMENYNDDEAAPWIDYSPSIIKIILEDGVASIGDCAFYEFENLTSATIPSSVTRMGNAAFYECESLTSITIPNTLSSIDDYTFYDCSCLTSLIIPNSVTSIGRNAFGACSGLTSITIPDSVINIEYGAFSGCSGLTSIIIPNSVTSIKDGVFFKCSSLRTISIPTSVTSIGQDAFSVCESLINITLPENVTSIGISAFSYCSSLSNITIPYGVKSIERYTFYECESLKNITVPNSVTSIGEGAFEDCVSLKSADIPTSVTSIGKYAFGGCSSLTSITIPDSVTKIENSAIYGCPKLTIYGYSGSCAETYAHDNNIPFIGLDSGSSIKASDISLNKKSAILYAPGAEKSTYVTLKASTKKGSITSVSFKSSNTSIASVNKTTGKVIAKTPGKATIIATVKAKNGSYTVTAKLTCKVTVKKPTLSVNPTSLSINKGKTKKLTVKTVPAGTIAYKSSNTSIANVSKAGVITGKKKGTCDVTVSCNGVKKTVKVTVS